MSCWEIYHFKFLGYFGLHLQVGSQSVSIKYGKQLETKLVVDWVQTVDNHAINNNKIFFFLNHDNIKIPCFIIFFIMKYERFYVK